MVWRWKQTWIPCKNTRHDHEIPETVWKTFANVAKKKTQRVNVLEDFPIFFNKFENIPGSGAPSLTTFVCEMSSFPSLLESPLR